MNQWLCDMPTPDWERDGCALYLGDCRQRLAALPAASVHCCVTSVPYWALRDYGVPHSIWGGEAGCAHEWGDVAERTLRGLVGDKSTIDGDQGRGGSRLERVSHGAVCSKCGAWRGAYGLEPTPELYVEHTVAIFREVHRVLRDDGVLWLNLGDSYASGGGSGAQGKSGQRAGRTHTQRSLGVNVASRGSRNGHDGKHAYQGGSLNGPNRMPLPGLKPKDLIGIPWMAAFALRADGWYLRADLPWVKRNGMPDSTRDRPGRALEYVFLLSKSRRNYFDMEAVRREPTGIIGGACFGGPLKDTAAEQKGAASLRTQHRAATKEDRQRYAERGRQWRNCDLWFDSIDKPHGMTGVGDQLVGIDCTTQPYKGAHFATFPEHLVTPLVLAGCPAGGVVLDPFAGTGTTAVVAIEHGRSAVLIELNDEYARLLKQRVGRAERRLFAGAGP